MTSDTAEDAGGAELRCLDWAWTVLATQPWSGRSLRPGAQSMRSDEWKQHDEWTDGVEVKNGRKEGRGRRKKERTIWP